jgi:F-type H+-transporting ATPase subunit b
MVNDCSSVNVKSVSCQISNWCKRHREPGITFLTLILALTLLDSTVLAAENAHAEGWGWLDTIGRWTNLLILFGILAFFLRTPLKRFFSGRALAIKDELESSAQAYERARADKAAAEERVRRIDEEVARLREEAEREAEAERIRVREQAERDAQRLIENARREIEILTRTAQKELREFAADLAVNLAESRIRRELKPQDESRVIDRFFVTLADKKRE